MLCSEFGAVRDPILRPPLSVLVLIEAKVECYFLQSSEKKGSFCSVSRQYFHTIHKKRLKLELHNDFMRYNPFLDFRGYGGEGLEELEIIRPHILTAFLPSEKQGGYEYNGTDV